MADMVDNDRGNNTGMTPPQRYAQLHPSMQTVFEKASNHQSTNHQNFVDPETPTAMWAMMAAHMEKNSPSGRDCRVVYVDNFIPDTTLGSS